MHDVGLAICLLDQQMITLGDQHHSTEVSVGVKLQVSLYGRLQALTYGSWMPEQRIRDLAAQLLRAESDEVILAVGSELQFVLARYMHEVRARADSDVAVAGSKTEPIAAA